MEEFIIFFSMYKKNMHYKTTYLAVKRQLNAFIFYV